MLGSILVGSGSGKLLANDIPTSQSVSELWAPTAMSVPTTAAPSESWRFDDDDDDDEDEAYSGSYSAAQEIQVLPAPSQNGAVTAPQAPSQPSHGRTGGS